MSQRRPTPLQRRFGHATRCSRCQRPPGTHWLRLEWHHVTYTPEIVAALCRGCHRRVTRLNRLAARELRRRLTNADRWAVWRAFLASAGRTCP